MKYGILERKDGDTLMGVYQALDLDGTFRRELMVHEMVTLFAVADGIRKGEIQTVQTLQEERIGDALKWGLKRERRRKRKRRTIRLKIKNGGSSKNANDKG